MSALFNTARLECARKDAAIRALTAACVARPAGWARRRGAAGWLGRGGGRAGQPALCRSGHRARRAGSGSPTSPATAPCAPTPTPAASSASGGWRRCSPRRCGGTSTRCDARMPMWRPLSPRRRAARPHTTRRQPRDSSSSSSSRRSLGCSGCCHWRRRPPAQQSLTRLRRYQRALGPVAAAAAAAAAVAAAPALRCRQRRSRGTMPPPRAALHGRAVLVGAALLRAHTAAAAAAAAAAVRVGWAAGGRGRRLQVGGGHTTRRQPRRQAAVPGAPAAAAAGSRSPRRINSRPPPPTGSRTHHRCIHCSRSRRRTTTTTLTAAAAAGWIRHRRITRSSARLGPASWGGAARGLARGATRTAAAGAGAGAGAGARAGSPRRGRAARPPMAVAGSHLRRRIASTAAGEAPPARGGPSTRTHSLDHAHARPPQKRLYHTSPRVCTRCGPSGARRGRRRGRRSRRRVGLRSCTRPLASRTPPPPSSPTPRAAALQHPPPQDVRGQDRGCACDRCARARRRRAPRTMPSRRPLTRGLTAAHSARAAPRRSTPHPAHRRAPLSRGPPPSPRAPACAHALTCAAPPPPLTNPELQGQVLKKIIDAIKDLVTDGNLECSAEAISLQVRGRTGPVQQPALWRSATAVDATERRRGPTGAAPLVWARSGRFYRHGCRRSCASCRGRRRVAAVRRCGCVRSGRNHPPHTLTRRLASTAHGGGRHLQTAPRAHCCVA